MKLWLIMWKSDFPKELTRGSTNLLVHSLLLHVKARARSQRAEACHVNLQHCSHQLVKNQQFQWPTGLSLLSCGGVFWGPYTNASSFGHTQLELHGKEQLGSLFRAQKE